MDRRELSYIYTSILEGDRAFETRWLDAGSSMGVHASCGSTVTMSKVGKSYQGVASGLVHHLNRFRITQSGWCRRAWASAYRDCDGPARTRQVASSAAVSRVMAEVQCAHHC